jgi:tryptophan synthase beta chain
MSRPAGRSRWIRRKTIPCSWPEFPRLAARLAGRPRPSTAPTALRHVRGARLWLKREDCTHTARTRSQRGRQGSSPAHGKKRVIAETGAATRRGHGHIAAASVSSARSSWARDVKRQAPNVRRRNCTARRCPRHLGHHTALGRDDRALRYWSGASEDTFYSSAPSRPAPLPEMAATSTRHRRRTPRSSWEKKCGKPPTCSALVGGGSNAMACSIRLDDPCEMFGRRSRRRRPRHARHGPRSAVLARRTARGPDLPAPVRRSQIHEAWSISAGLDYPASARTRLLHDQARALRGRHRSGSRGCLPRPVQVRGIIPASKARTP